MGFTIIFTFILGLCVLAPTEHNLGYEQEVFVHDAEPCDPLYYSIIGVEDKVYWDRSTPIGQAIYERAKYLANIIGYEGDDIACDGMGMRLLTGINKDVLYKEKN